MNILDYVLGDDFRLPALLCSLILTLEWPRLTLIKVFWRISPSSLHLELPPKMLIF